MSKLYIVKFYEKKQCELAVVTNKIKTCNLYNKIAKMTKK